MRPEDQPTYGSIDHDDDAAQATTPSEIGRGKVIGPYRLSELVGEGGMGAVWLAEQTEPVRRRVALKLINDVRFARIAAQAMQPAKAQTLE